MTLDDKQFDRVASCMDGQDVHLSIDEQQARSDIHRNEALMASLLDVDVPPETLAKANRMMLARLAHRRRIAFKRVALAGAIASAAAIILFAALSGLLPHITATADDLHLTEVPSEVLFDALQPTEDMQGLDEFAGEVVILEAEILASNATLLQSDIDDIDIELDAIRQGLDGFWVEENIAEIPEG